MSKLEKPPIRLRVSYNSPQSLIGELTRSVGKGGVAIESKRPLPVGTRFVFALRAAGVHPDVLVPGEVMRVSTSSATGEYLLHIRYDFPSDRNAVDEAVRQIFASQASEKKRRHARIPLQFRATEKSPYSPSYIVRNVSRGGVRVEAEGTTFPRSVKVGTAVRLELRMLVGVLELMGKVVWVFAPETRGAEWVSPACGIQFGPMSPYTLERLDKIIQLQNLPPAPWTAYITFGGDAEPSFL